MKVRTAPEGDGQIDLPERDHLHVGNEPVERRSCGSDVRSCHPNSVVGLGVQNVQANLAIHQDLGLPGLVDDEREANLQQHVAGWFVWSKVIDASNYLR